MNEYNDSLTKLKNLKWLLEEEYIDFNMFIDECLRLDRNGKLGNLNYMKKIATIEYENGVLERDIYKKYISLPNDKTTWNYEDWKFFLGKEIKVIKDKINHEEMIVFKNKGN